jgi:hypothetical protein
MRDDDPADGGFLPRGLLKIPKTAHYSRAVAPTIKLA